MPIQTLPYNLHSKELCVNLVCLEICYYFTYISLDLGTKLRLLHYRFYLLPEIVGGGAI